MAVRMFVAWIIFLEVALAERRVILVHRDLSGGHDGGGVIVA